MPPTQTSHQDEPQTQDANERFEVYTSKSGIESDTGNFEFPTDASKYLDSSDLTAKGGLLRKVTYDRKPVGYFRTITPGKEVGSRKALVKMHLVNSYLHPKANEWGGNWFWGSHGLNKLHNVFEEKAKLVHPKHKVPRIPPSVLLRYETKVGTERPKTPTIAAFRETIMEKLTRIRDNGIGFASDVALDKDKVKIGADKIDTFYAKWNEAVGTYAYASFVVTYQFATGTAPSLTWLPNVISPDASSKLVETFLPDVAASTRLETFLAPFLRQTAPRKRFKVKR